MVYTGATPTREGGFDFGAYLGESLGSGFSSGLQKSMEGYFEQSAIDKALKGLPADATPDQQAMAVLKSRASPQSKSQWMQYLKLQQKMAPKAASREDIEKYIGSAASASDRVSSMTKDMEPMQRERLLNKIDADIRANPGVPMQTIVNKNLQGLMEGTLYQEAPQEGKQVVKTPPNMPPPKKDILKKAQEGSLWTEEGRKKLYENIKKSPGVLGLRQTAIGDLFGISDLSPEDIAAIGEMDPAEHVLMQATSLAAEYLPYSKAIKAYGALKGFAIMGGARSLFRDIYKEIKKEGPTTSEDVMRIGKNALENAAKEAVMGGIFDKIPGLSKTLEKLGVPKQLVDNATFKGVSRLFTTGAALSLLNPLLEGRVTNPKDIEEAFANAVLMESMHIPQEARSQMPAAEAPRAPAPEPSPAGPTPERPPSYPLTGEQAAELQKVQTPVSPTGPVPGAPEQMLSPKAESLVGRATKGPAEGPTPLRTERLQPEQRLYKTKEQVELREEQLKKYPEKEIEVLADQAEKAQNDLKKPSAEKTTLAREEANRRLGEDRASFDEAARLVRSLEEQVAAHPERAAQLEPRLRHAKNQLFFAENQLRQTLQNIKTGEGRKNAKEMIAASQEKLSAITDALAQGKEVVFADELPKGEKFDAERGIKLNRNNYSKERLKAAKSLSAQEKLRANKQNDFYTEVHEQYNAQYEKRLADIESAISREKAKANPSKELLSTLGKEKEIVGKMLDHNKADILIHRHKLALREMHQRKQFAEKMQKMKPAEMNKKIKEVTDRTLKYFEKPTEENLQKLSEESGIPKEELKEGINLAEETAKKSANENLKEVIEEQAKKRDESEQKKIPTSTRLNRFKRDLQHLWNNKFNPSEWWKNPLGRQLFILGAVKGYNAVMDDPDDKIKASDLAAASFLLGGRNVYSTLNTIIAAIEHQVKLSISKKRVEEYIRVSSGPNPNYRRKFELEQEMTPKEKKKAKERSK